MGVDCKFPRASLVHQLWLRVRLRLRLRLRLSLRLGQRRGKLLHWSLD
jgi:hypothetical protein